MLNCLISRRLLLHSCVILLVDLSLLRILIDWLLACWLSLLQITLVAMILEVEVNVQTIDYMVDDGARKLKLVALFCPLLSASLTNSHSAFQVP